MRLGSIGCGRHAESSHGPAQAKCAATRPGLELVACCDVDAGRADEHRRRFGFAQAYSDAFAMIEATKPDAVVVIVPEDAIADLSERLFAYAIPLLIEKPPGRTLAEVDRLIAAAERGGRGGAPVPHQVGLNRRFVPLLREARKRLEAVGGASSVQHVHYEMTRVDRRDSDFSVTAIHGIDAVRYLAGSDYAQARFRYRELPELGPGVANIFMDAVMASGATAHLAFCPVAGVLVERAAIHALEHTFFGHVPLWDAFDSPGRLQHIERGKLAGEVVGSSLPGSAEAFELGGFHAEYEAFLDDLAAGRAPSPSLREARQSVAIAEQIRLRRDEFRA